MGRSILLLRLEGPLQSWGTRSRWDVRDTGPEPTKSGVIGLLGCAFGYPMYDLRLEALDAALRFGVRVESPGRVLEDYQTITDFLPTAEGSFRHSGVKTAASLEKLRNDPDVTPATILSPRAYLEDAAFLAALEQADGGDAIVEDCAAALNQPKWPLYLGRKTCIPTRPICETVTKSYKNLEDALRKHPWSWLGSNATPRRVRERPAKLEAFIEVPERTTGTDIAVRQDVIRTNAARVYDFRTVKRFPVDFPGDPIPETTHVPQQADAQHP
jgi:CRISPR system Cascade subunit CasD